MHLRNPTDDTAILRNTNVNRPQFGRPTSKRSVAAHTEEASRAGSRPVSTVSYKQSQQTTGDRPTTPPMNSIPAAHVHDDLHYDGSSGAETFLPSTKDVMNRLAYDAREGPPAHFLDGPNDRVYHQRTQSNGSSNSNNSIRRKPISRPASSRYSNGPRYSQLDPNPGPPTPGADDGAVQFALDQLTRDNDVRGESRHYAGGRFSEQVPEQTSLLDGNNEYDAPISHFPAVAAVQPTYTYVPPIANYAPVERQNIPVVEARVRQSNKIRPVAPVMVAEPIVSPIVPVTRVAPVQRSVVVERTVPAQVVKPMRPITPPTATALPSPPETFNDYDPNDKSLKTLPTILNPLFLPLYILLVILMLAALIFSGVWSSTHLGLWGYTMFGGGRWFVFKYLPTILCMIMLIWLFQIQNAVQRIAPFIALASNNPKSRTAAPMMEQQPTQFLLPKLFYFGAGQPIVGLFMFIAWLHIFTPPLFATLFNVYFYGPIGLGGPGNWIWATVQGIVWTLVGLYFLLLVALILLALWLWRQRSTGVKWDPRSLATMVAVLDRSNVATHYNGSESWNSNKQFRERLAYRTDRLGYWSTSRSQNDYFYALGEAGAEAPRGFSEASRIGNEKYSLDQRNRYSYDERNGTNGINGTNGMYRTTSQTVGGPIVTDIDKRDDLYSIRYRYLPWYLRLPAIIFFSALVIILFLLYLIASYVNHAVWHGFSTPFFIAPDNGVFSATNFFFSFIPALIAQIFFLCWLSVDYAFRRLQPYANMSNREGATASRSIFLDYPARIPFSCTISALIHRDLIVAWFSFVSLVAAAMPVLAGGTFMSQFYVAEQQTRVSVDREGYYALNVVTGIYALSLPLAIFAARKRLLPHSVTTLADQFSWLYASRLLGEREWRAQAATKSDLHTRLQAPITPLERQLKGGEGRYAFGRFIGTDGQPHLGIDRIGERTRMAERKFRQSGETTAINTVVNTPYPEVEEIPPHPATIVVPEPVLEPTLPVVKAVPVLAGPSAVALSHPTVVASTTIKTGAPGYYDPYAKPELTDAAGFPVARELAPVVAPSNAPGAQLHRDVVGVAGVDRRGNLEAMPLLPAGGVAPGAHPRLQDGADVRGVPGLAEMPRPVGPGAWRGEVGGAQEYGYEPVQGGQQWQGQVREQQGYQQQGYEQQGFQQQGYEQQGFQQQGYEQRGYGQGQGQGQQGYGQQRQRGMSGSAPRQASSGRRAPGNTYI